MAFPASSQPRNAAEAGHQSQTKLGSERAILSGNNEVAGQRQLEPAAENDSVHGGNRRERGSIQR
jgi:hypothetical protein